MEKTKIMEKTGVLERARQYETEHRIPFGERPLFHLTPPVGWINDPNGFSVYQGKIHLFYQYHPYSTKWGAMHWGHQVTEDMICWEERPAALAPDMPYDKGGCFSGSAIETEEGHVLVYTGVAEDENGREVQNQCIAVGDGTDYKKTAGRPVVTGDMLPEGFSRAHFRDPKVWKDGEAYYLVVGNLDGEENGQIVLFSGRDLYHWKYEGVLAHSGGTLGKMWECPDFFELDGRYVLICSPQDMRAWKYEFHNGNNAVYFLGGFDKEKKQFFKEEPRSLDYGLDFYAPQTTLLPDGRRVMIAWMKSWDASFIPAGQKWQGMMTLPRELSIEKGRLVQRPVREFMRYRKNRVSYEKETVEGGRRFQGICGRTIDFTVTVYGENFHEFAIDVAENEEYATHITWNRDKGILEIDRTHSGLARDASCIRRVRLEESGGKLTLRLILDYHSVEIFVNHGEMTLSTVIYTPLSADGILFSCDGNASVDIEKYDIELPGK